jgi:hypothetical protein
MVTETTEQGGSEDEGRRVGKQTNDGRLPTTPTTPMVNNDYGELE